MADETDGWVDAEDRVPADGRTVLARGHSRDSEFNGGFILACRVGANERKWVTGKQQEEVEVTHWRPLPSCPVETVAGVDANALLDDLNQLGRGMTVGSNWHCSVGERAVRVITELLELHRESKGER